MSVRSRTLVVVAAAASLILSSFGVSAAAVAADPPPVPHGSVFYDDFTSGTTGWKALAGSLSAWKVSADAHPVVSVDTTGQSSGDYIRPTAALQLPDSYQLSTTLRVDSAASDATVSLILDMVQPDNIKAQNTAVQFGGFDSTGRESVQVASPLGSQTLCKGATPLTKGDWHTIVVTRAGGIIAAQVDGTLVAAEPSGAAGSSIALGSYHSSFSIGAVSVDALSSVPSTQPTTALGCPMVTPVTPPDPGTGSGTVSGSGTWVDSASSTTNAPGHEVTSGQATIDLDGTWQFAADSKGTGVADGYPDPSTDTSSWDSMTVPGNWDTKDAYGEYKGIGWYKTAFQTGDLDAASHQHAVLKFDAVYWTATVWLNGQRLGSHTGGYTPFEFDVSKYLVDGTNTLVVEADNSFSQGAWWAWGGISRDVTLIRTGDVEIDHQEVVANPDLATGAATVTSTVTVHNWSDTDATVSVSGRVTDTARASTVETASPSGDGTVAVPAKGTADVVLTSQLSPGQYKLWGLDSPNLYRFDATVDAGDRGGDAVSDQFGIRSIVISGTSILLNGQKVKLAGANRVSDDPLEGNTEPEDLVRRDLDRMKAAGMNMMRIMHYPQAPDLLDYADQIGMLIIAEVPEWGSGKNLIGDLPKVQAQMTEAVDRDFNHPSIFAYSIANEIDSNTANGITYDKQMAAFSHSIDPSRFVTQVSDQIQHITNGDQDGSQFMDFVSVNMYSDFAAFADHDHAMYPNVPLFVSEYSPDGFSFPTDKESLDFTTGAGSTSDTFRSRDYIAGWSQWTFNDYRSDYGGSSTDLIRGWGDVDVWGRLKKSYDLVQTANAPVSSLKLVDPQYADGEGVGVAAIVPRGTADTDGPVYTLSGYSVVLRVTDASGKVVGGSVTPLPDIKPGDSERDIPVTWSDGGKGVAAELTLLSPTGYEVATSTTALAVPAKPNITATVAASTSVRVRFSDPADVRNYRAEAVDGSGKVVATVTTAEQFADLSGLGQNTAYTVRVVAVDGAGDSAADTADVSTTGSLAMAPKIDTLAPVQNGLVLGFSDKTAKATFEVKVVDAETGAQVQDYTTTNRPGTRVENLDAGVAYDVSIRRLSGGDAATAWSEPMRGTALGASTKPSLVVGGVVAGATSAGVIITPQADVERYTIDISGPQGERTVDVEHAAVNLLPVDGLQPSSTYTVKVVAHSATGASDAWTGTVTTSGGGQAPGTPTRVGFENRGDDVYLTWAPAQGDQPDGYVITRSACGTTTTTVASGTDEKIGELASSGGSYTVAAFEAGQTSAPSAAVSVPGDEDCVYVVTPKDTTARPDASVPFSSSSGWQSSSVTGAGGYPSVYATLSTTPDATATWTAPDVGDVRFTVEVSLPDSYAASSAQYTLHTVDGDKTVTVDQGANGGTWVDLGEYEFSSAVPGNVTLHDGSTGYLRASAVRFTTVTPGTVTSAPAPTIENQTINSGSAISGTGTGVGDAIRVTASDGTELGTAVVGSDFAWSIVPALAVGVWDGVSVTETDSEGWTGRASATITVLAKDSPSGPLAFTLTVSSVHPGDIVAVTAKGFAANEKVNVVLHSAPRTLATVHAANDGTISTSVAIPADVEPGAHHLILRGASSGEVSGALTVLRVTPAAAGVRDAEAAGSLATTGSSIVAGLVVSLLLAAAGTWTVLMARRRRSS